MLAPVCRFIDHIHRCGVLGGIRLDMEDMCMRALRRCGHPLLNRNRAKGGDRRAYMRAWRARNPDYMAQKGREHRERRRLTALALAATNDGDAQ